MMKGQFGWVQEKAALKYVDVTKERPTKMAEILTDSKVPKQKPSPISPQQAQVGVVQGARVPVVPDASIDELATKFEGALNLTSLGHVSQPGQDGKTTHGTLALALGVLGSTGVPATVTLAAPSGENISIKVEGSRFQISNY